MYFIKMNGEYRHPITHMPLSSYQTSEYKQEALIIQKEEKEKGIDYSDIGEKIYKIIIK